MVAYKRSKLDVWKVTADGMRIHCMILCMFHTLSTLRVGIFKGD